MPQTPRPEDEEGQRPEAMPSQHISVPVPDPTTLTTQQMLRTVAHSREVLETRLTGMDKAIVLLQTAGTQQAEQTLRLLGAVEKGLGDRITAVGERFECTTDDLRARVLTTEKNFMTKASGFIAFFLGGAICTAVYLLVRLH